MWLFVMEKKGLSQQKVATSVGVTFHYRLSSPDQSHLFWVQFCPKNKNATQFHFLQNQNILKILVSYRRKLDQK